jgi:hypothetical protein
LTTIRGLVYFGKNGGVSSQRPFSTPMNDLRKIRKEEGLLIANSWTIDLMVSFLIVKILGIIGKLYFLLRFVSRTFINEVDRVTP